MREFQRKTTRITNGNDLSQIDVEYATGGYLLDGSHPRSRQVVALTAPDSSYHRRLSLANLSPQAALNLLAWLRAEEFELKALIAQEQNA